ncbi:unnamed protein product [Xylocopa violacea]|uniref:Uncharacterized protein n=1 Tax=Xylocopa violacea TaxID=135666 RepID=A0ABP1NAZ7_XYLVO
MSTQTVKPTQENGTNRRLSGSSSERIIFYMDDASFEISHEPSPDYCQRSNNCYASHHSEDRASFSQPHFDATVFQSDDRSALYLPSPDEARLNASVHAKTGNSRQIRKNSEPDQRSSRRSSVQSSRSRTNSCSRLTPLGNGRRGSSSRRTKPRNAGSTRRKDSARPLKMETKEAQKIVENVENLEQARRHRRIAMIVLGTFLFLLAASVLVVVVTLTHSTFLSPPTGSKELAEHRARSKLLS